jgi:hypothetical protein
MIIKANIYFTERNIHGAWVVYGSEGIKQYYGYTKRQAIERYKQDAKSVYAETTGR